MRTRRPGHPGGCDGALVEPSSLGTGRQVGKLSSNVDVKSTRPFAEKTKTSKLKLTKLGLTLILEKARSILKDNMKEENDELQSEQARKSFT